ncbi:MAG: endolytic transglycosylase MltG [Candidatus Moranbacteria bacterium]|nr:endolytic transglycosylase MltG [Candidatus Moranbacteria bacterium]
MFVRLARATVFFVVGIAVFIGIGLAVLSRSVEDSRGGSGPVIVTVGEREGVVVLATDLRRRGIIASELPFLYHVFREGLRTRLLAGRYALSGEMSIPDIARKIVRGETVEKGVKVTFPEGLTAAEMAERLDAAGFDGASFLSAVAHPAAALRERYPFLSVAPAGASLEGFLFPDTYFFDPTQGTDAVIGKMLDAFGKTVEPLLKRKPAEQRFEALTLASIVETEVRTDADRGVVADLFLRRIALGMPLQSDATVRYALGETKVKHSLKDIAVDSPYNTYANKGLPPGPISNPGLSSIRAVLDPTPNRYLYFLNNPETGETVFAETFEEHIANKAKNGL